MNARAIIFIKIRIGDKGNYKDTLNYVKVLE